MMLKLRLLVVKVTSHLDPLIQLSSPIDLWLIYSMNDCSVNDDDDNPSYERLFKIFSHSWAICLSPLPICLPTVLVAPSLPLAVFPALDL